MKTDPYFPDIMQHHCQVFFPVGSYGIVTYHSVSHACYTYVDILAQDVFRYVPKHNLHKYKGRGTRINVQWGLMGIYFHSSIHVRINGDYWIG